MTIKVKLTQLAKDLIQENEEDNSTDYSLSFIPKRATEGSNGYDLFACIAEPLTIRYNEIVKIPTGVHVHLGDGLTPQTAGTMAYAGLYLPRSSNNSLVLTNTVGLHDSDYQGESFLKYKNIGEAPVVIKTGDKIGQLLIVPSFITELHLVADFEEETTRGEGGFGSTGV